MSLKKTEKHKIILVMEGGVLQSATASIDIAVVVHDIDELNDQGLIGAEQQVIYERLAEGCHECDVASSDGSSALLRKNADAASRFDPAYLNYETAAEAVALIRAHHWPDSALWALVQYEARSGEFGFASEVLKEYGYT